ncbi:MAG: hypothetical protein LBG70_03260, partial [Bifidobacteriaceae bacterium]|nr:hypothetical protein [Bifidobacteriaceae bacterium]
MNRRAVLAAILAGVWLLTGCTGSIPTVKAPPRPEVPPPAVTETQTDRILAELATQLAAADVARST